VLIVTAFAAAAQAQQLHPINISDTRPVVIVQGIPSARDPEIIAPDEWKLQVDYDLTNHFSHNSNSNEVVMFDGESQRLSVTVHKGFGPDIEIGFIVPFIQYSGGHLDAFIESWHDFFNLPQNGRDQAPRNQLRFYYQKNGKVWLDLTEPVSGVGDVQVLIARKIHGIWLPDQNNLAVKAAIKFPTGDPDKLTGNGAMALSTWLAGDMRSSWFGFPGMTYTSLGASLLQQGDVLPDQQRSFALFGGLGSGMQINDAIALQAQLDAHSSLFRDSSLREINSVTLQLTLGGNVKLSKEFNFDIGVVEDLLTQAAPDVIFHVGLNGRW